MRRSAARRIGWAAVILTTSFNMTDFPPPDITGIAAGIGSLEPQAPVNRPRVEEVEVLYEFKPRISAGTITTVTHRIMEVVARHWPRVPIVTGTTVGTAYRYDKDHLGGCAVDVRTWGITDLERRTKAIADELVRDVDPHAYVILWSGHSRRPDHLHIEIDGCGNPESPRDTHWSLNGE